jgi:C1A family cysteine protease
MKGRRIKPRTIPRFGYRRDKLDRRDRMFDHAAVANLPAVVDLRSNCPAPMDQGELGSCTAHGITAVVRYAMKKAGLSDRPLSRLQLYYDERAIEGTVKIDAGAEIRDGIKSAAKLGVAHEDLWPYVVTKFKTKPPAKVYKDALQFQALTYERVAVDVAAIKAALASGFPVVVGANVFEQFESEQAAHDGVIAVPAAHEQSIGGHCFYLVGYGQKPGYLTARNSWGDWGDKGDFYLPEAYLGTGGQGSDYWIVRSVG